MHAVGSKKASIWHKFQIKARPPRRSALFDIGLNSGTYGNSISDSYVHFSLDKQKIWEYYPNKMSF